MPSSSLWVFFSKLMGDSVSRPPTSQASAGSGAGLDPVVDHLGYDHPGAVREDGQQAIDEVRAMTGLAGAYLLVSTDSGRVVKLVRRTLSPTDARVRYLLLTAEGERRLAPAVAELREDRETLSRALAELEPSG